MPRKTGATVPSPVDPAGNISRVICIPASPEWLALVNGALWVLTQEWYYDPQTGDASEAAGVARQFYFDYLQQTGACIVPSAIVGEIRMMATSTLPDGWLYCNGDVVSKETYAALWNAITDFWGADTETTFTLPDLRNRFPLGYMQGGGVPVFASMGGSETVTLTEAQMPAHNHLTWEGNQYAAFAAGGAGVGLSGGGAFSGYVTGSKGSGQAHNNMPPYAAISFIIYAG